MKTAFRFLQRSIPTLALATLAVTLLAGCGWHLRGTSMIPEGLSALHIGARDDQSPLVEELKRVLRAGDIAVPDKAEDADFSLVIIEEHSSVRTATVNANARVSEQQLTEEAEFMILDGAGKILLPRSTVTVERVFEYDENNVLATQDEKELIRAEMHRDLAAQILNRLRQLRHLTDAPAS